MKIRLLIGVMIAVGLMTSASFVIVALACYASAQPAVAGNQ